jgi:hypothetical protein
MDCIYVLVVLALLCLHDDSTYSETHHATEAQQARQTASRASEQPEYDHHGRGSDEALAPAKPVCHRAPEQVPGHHAHKHDARY